MNKIGYSVYLSNYLDVKEELKALFQKGNYIFISLHIQEENTINYLDKVKNMIHFLKNIGYLIIADVSKITLNYLNYDNFIELKKDLKIDLLRLDYGFEISEIIELAKLTDICLNASTVDNNLLTSLKRKKLNLLFIHNFYPHPETGLDKEQYQRINNMISGYGYKIITFISGDNKLRGPIFEGLVTLEHHRYKSPYYQFLDLIINYRQEIIIVGDSILTSRSVKQINNYLESGVVEIKVHLDQEYKYLYNKVFTIRNDSPKKLKRLVESREYSKKGNIVKAKNCTSRYRGSITIDNLLYKRYSGEIMVCLEDFTCDDRVNVIGRVREMEMLDLIINGIKIKFVNE